MGFVSIDEFLRGQTASLFPPPRPVVQGTDPYASVIALNKRLFGSAAFVIDDPFAVAYNVRKNVTGKTSGHALSVHVGGCPYRCAGCYVDHRKNAGDRETLLRTMERNLPRALVAVPQDANILDAYIEKRFLEHEAKGGGKLITYSGGEPLGQRGWLVGNLIKMKAAGRRASIDTMGLALALEPDYLAPFADANLQDDIIFHVSSKPVLPDDFLQLTHVARHMWVTPLIGMIHAFHDGFLVAPTGPIDNYWSGHEIAEYYALLKAIDPELPRVARSLPWKVGETFSQNAGQARKMIRSAGFQWSTGKTASYKGGTHTYEKHEFIFNGSATQKLVPQIIRAMIGQSAIATTPQNPAVTNRDYLACLGRIRTRLMAQRPETMPVYRELKRIMDAGADATAETLVIDPAVAPIDSSFFAEFAKPLQRRTNVFPA